MHSSAKISNRSQACTLSGMNSQGAPSITEIGTHSSQNAINWSCLSAASSSILSYVDVMGNLIMQRLGSFCLLF